MTSLRAVYMGDIPDFDEQAVSVVQPVQFKNDVTFVRKAHLKHFERQSPSRARGPTEGDDIVSQ